MHLVDNGVGEIGIVFIVVEVGDVDSRRCPHHRVTWVSLKWATAHQQQRGSHRHHRPCPRIHGVGVIVEDVGDMPVVLVVDMAGHRCHHRCRRT